MNGKESFNSILVQLEASVLLSETKLTVTFQFHIGAIRSSQDFRHSAKNSWFQFHIGAIRRTEGVMVILPMPLFQFHIGAIRRRELKRIKQGKH